MKSLNLYVNFCTYYSYTAIQLHGACNAVHIACTFLVRNYKVLLHNKTIACLNYLETVLATD